MLYQSALKTLEHVGGEIALSFRQEFPDISELNEVDLAPVVLPVVARLPCVGDTSSTTVNFVEKILQNAHSRHWRQPYQINDFGEVFFHGTAWFPLADKDGPVVYSNGLMEVMLLDRCIAYPEHRHAPEELYVVLAGDIYWQAGNGQSGWRSAGDVIHHPPHRVHSIRSG